MRKLLFLGLTLAVGFTACNKDKEDEKYKGPPASTGTTMKLNGGEGGMLAKNSVFVDLSTETQTSVARNSWHLGFYCGDEFGVILNGTIGARATEAPKGMEVTTVIPNEDTAAYIAKLTPGMMEGGAKFGEIADGLGYDLSKTIIKKGKTYLYTSAKNEGVNLYKVKVTQSNNEYTLSYALWNSSDVKTVSIPKKSDYLYIGASLITNSVVNIQNPKNNWDIVWGRTTYKQSADKPDIALVISDVIFLNKGIEAAEVLVTETLTYNNYTEKNIAATAFKSDIDVIGISWRVSKINTTTVTTEIKAATDRFYVIKDFDGNYYKLRFISVSADDGGVRGYPEIEYAIIK